jgi:uncharacterized protein YegP (UPF0339 family)
LRYNVGATAGEGYSWWLYGNNNELVAWAGEAFVSLSNAQRAARSFKQNAVLAYFELYQDASFAWRWRAWRSSDKVAASGESFSNKATAERAAANVRSRAGEGTGL